MRTLAFALLVFALPVHAATYTTHQLRDTSRGLFIRPSFGVNMSLIVDDNAQSEGIIGPGGGLTLEYYFSPTVGIYGSGSVFSGNRFATKQNVQWGFGSVGATFQFHLFNADLVTTFGAGGFAAFPLTNFRAAGSPANFQTTGGFELRLTQYFPLSDNFEIGISSEIQIPILPIVGVLGDRSLVGGGGGVSLRVLL